MTLFSWKVRVTSWINFIKIFRNRFYLTINYSYFFRRGRTGCSSIRKLSYVIDKKKKKFKYTLQNSPLTIHPILANCTFWIIYFQWSNCSDCSNGREPTTSTTNGLKGCIYGKTCYNQVALRNCVYLFKRDQSYINWNRNIN